MPYYDYSCKKCRIVWELEFDVGKASKSPKCPECNKKGERYWGSAPVTLFGSDRDYQTVRNRDKKGPSTTAIDYFYNTEMAESKTRQKEMRGYVRYNMDPAYWSKRGMRKIYGKEKLDKDYKARELIGRFRKKLHEI